MKFIFLTFGLLYFSIPALAGDILTFSPAHLTGEQGSLPRLTLWRGSGLNVNLCPLGSSIEKVWLDDPSKITVDFNAPPGSGRSCIVHLRRINPIDFSVLPATSKTLFTVVTADRRYQFVLQYGEGEPHYYGVTVAETSQKEVLPLSWEREVRAGLQAAQSLGLISVEQGNQVLVRRVERVLSAIARGQSLSQAAAIGGVSLDFLEKLAQMGRETQPLETPTLETQPLEAQPLETPATENDATVEENRLETR